MLCGRQSGQDYMCTLLPPCDAPRHCLALDDVASLPEPTKDKPRQKWMPTVGCWHRPGRQKGTFHALPNSRLHLGRARSCGPMRASLGRLDSSAHQLIMIRRHCSLLRRHQLGRQQHSARRRCGRRPCGGDHYHRRGTRCHRRGPRWRVPRRGGRRSGGRCGWRGLGARLLAAAAQQAAQQSAQLALQGGPWLACGVQARSRQQEEREYVSSPALTSSIW